MSPQCILLDSQSTGACSFHCAANIASNSSDLMDAVFLLSEGEVSTFLQNMMQSFDCTYSCLWSFSPQPSNCLWYKNGFFHEKSDQASSSSGSLAQRLFTEYRQSIFMVESSHIPGLAFLNNLPYMELNSADLLRLASTETQRQFYREAGIKTGVFMGCSGGEIELGFADNSQVNLELEMRSWFPEDFSRQLVPRELPANPQPIDQNPRPTSSSSSLRSLSYDSPEYSPLLFDIPTSGYLQQPSQEAIFQQALRPAPSVCTTTSPHQQAIRALSQIRNIQIPTIESEDAAMTKAILTVISSPSSASSLQPQQILPPTFPVREQSSAFKWYMQALAPIVPMSARYRRQNMLKRSIAFLRRLNTMRTQEQVQASRTSTTQLHHMISERRRREKLNESFQALRSLLPPGTKKDKASVLARTTEYLSSLKAQVAELSKRNQILEAQLLPQKAAAEEATGSKEMVGVRITEVAASTSEARMIDLQVTRIGELRIPDMVVALLDFLKADHNLSLISIEAYTTIQESTSVNRVVLRLKIEGGDWDESAFQEAVRRVVRDMVQ